MGRPSRLRAGKREDHPGVGEVVGGDEVPEEVIADEPVVDDLLEHDLGTGLTAGGRRGQADLPEQGGEVAGEAVSGFVGPGRGAGGRRVQVDSGVSGERFVQDEGVAAGVDLDGDCSPARQASPR